MAASLDRLVVKLAQVKVTPYLRRGESGHIEKVTGYRRAQDLSTGVSGRSEAPSSLFQAEPVERLKALGGSWADWTKTKPWESSAGALTDPRLEVVGEREGIRSQGGMALGNIAATWEGERIKVGARAWDESTPDTRQFLLAHELSHAAAADILANMPMADRESMLAPFKADNGGFSEGALWNKDDAFARTREEMLADVGASILIFGADVLDVRFENEKKYDIGATPADPRLAALYTAVAESLRRVGHEPPMKVKLTAIAQLSKVVVPPYARLEDGKLIAVEGYTYQRAGAGALTTLQQKMRPAPASFSSKVDIEDQRKGGPPIHVDEAKLEASAIAAGIDPSKIKHIKLRFRDSNQLKKETAARTETVPGSGNYRVIIGIKPKDSYSEHAQYVVNNSLLHELRHVAQYQIGGGAHMAVQYHASKGEFAAVLGKQTKSYQDEEIEAQMFGRLAWHGPPADKPIGPLGEDKVHLGKDVWALKFEETKTRPSKVSKLQESYDETNDAILGAVERTKKRLAKSKSKYEFERADGGAPTSERKSFKEYLEENDYTMYHASSEEGVKAITSKGLLSDKDQGLPALSDADLDDIDEPYLHDGVFVGSKERASEFGEHLVAIDLRGIEGKLYEFVGGADEYETQALLVGSIDPSRIKRV